MPISINIFSHWPFREYEVDTISTFVVDGHMALNHTEGAGLHSYIIKYVNGPPCYLMTTDATRLLLGGLLLVATTSSS